MIIAGGGIAGAALGKTIAERGKRVRQRGRDQAIRASVHDAYRARIRTERRSQKEGYDVPTTPTMENADCDRS